MGTVRDIAGRHVMTHYFSTRYEVEKFVGVGNLEGWYYQIGVDPKAKMKGPFRILGDLTTAVANER